MKIQIVSDGTRNGTRVFNTESGEEITRLVKSITFHTGQDNQWRPEVSLELVPVVVTLAGDLRAVKLSDIEDSMKNALTVSAPRRYVPDTAELPPIYLSQPPRPLTPEPV